MFQLKNYQDIASKCWGIETETASLAMKHAKYLLLTTLGIDTRLFMETCLAGNYSKLKIYKALVQFYKVP